MPITRTITVTEYQFDELSDDAKQNALEKLWGLNVDHDWWDYLYEDAARIGLKIEEFDLGRRRSIDGKLTESLLGCCKLIRKNHGKACDTFKTAKQYLIEYIEKFKKWLAGEDKDGYEHWGNCDWLREFESSDEANDVTGEFGIALLQDYLIMLDKEYDYQTSEEAIIETIQANEYLFTENGVLA